MSSKPIIILSSSDLATAIGGLGCGNKDTSRGKKKDTEERHSTSRDGKHNIHEKWTRNSRGGRSGEVKITDKKKEEPAKYFGPWRVG